MSQARISMRSEFLKASETGNAKAFNTETLSKQDQIREMKYLRNQIPQDIQNHIINRNKKIVKEISQANIAIIKQKTMNEMSQDCC